MVRIGAVPGKGRGVLASGPIAKGTLIERAAAVRLPATERPLLDQTGVFAYYFADPAAFGKGDSHDCFLAFGALTFCNHAAEPNAAVSWEEDEVGLWALLHAVADIGEAEEVTLFYTNIDEYGSAEVFF